MKFNKIAIALSLVACSTISHSFDLTQLIGVAENVLREAKKNSPNANSAATPASTGNFGACQQNFANGNPPVAKELSGQNARALCFNGFAVLHSGKSKTPIYSAEVLSRERIQNAKGEVRTNNFFEDARLPSNERATLNDYSRSGFDRGHNAPAADMDNPEAMAQSFSLANMMPQAPEHNRKLWSGIETSTRKYALRAAGNVYVITGSVFIPGYCQLNTPNQNCTIGNGVIVPSHIYKLVYDASANRAWAYWTLNNDNEVMNRPISYAQLVQNTGIEFLPGVNPAN